MAKFGLIGEIEQEKTKYGVTVFLRYWRNSIKCMLILEIDDDLNCTHLTDIWNVDKKANSKGRELFYIDDTEGFLIQYGQPDFLDYYSPVQALENYFENYLT